VGVKMELLVHSCCGPCLTGTYEALKGEYQVVSFYYNPNIHPLQEYLRRFKNLKKFCQLSGLVLIAGEYDLRSYFKAVVGREENRCQYCYELRLNRTAEETAKLGLVSFTTTLTISPYQDHDLIKIAGERAAAKHKVKFIYFDFRSKYKRSIEISRSLDLYRQSYCGCLYSEVERYAKKLKEIEEKESYEFGTIG
jgi:hypothetical protein